MRPVEVPNAQQNTPSGEELALVLEFDEALRERVSPSITLQLEELKLRIRQERDKF